MAKIYDDDFLEVMRHLPAEWKTKHFVRAGMGWIAKISNRMTSFQLVSDRGYIGVSQIVDEKPIWIEPAPDMRMSISSKQVAEIILKNASPSD